MACDRPQRDHVSGRNGSGWFDRVSRSHSWCASRRNNGSKPLVANAASVLILMRYKDGDANVRSVWLCSRNDAIGNIAVMIAALAVWGTATKWPDLLVAAIMASLFLNSSIQILRQSFREMREAHPVPAE